MEKKKHLQLVQAGYAPVSSYVQQHMIRNLEACSTNPDGLGDFLSALKAYTEASSRFHRPGGDGYAIVQKCLQRYLDYKFIQKNQQFRFADIVENETQIPAKHKDINAHGSEKEQSVSLHGTRADIDYLLFAADQNSVASRRCKEYVYSSKLHLTAVLIRLIEQAVHAMETDGRAKIQKFGEILRITYMELQYAEIEVSALYPILGCSKKQYYNLRNQAITMVSEMLFGILAGENGLAELYMNEREIILPSTKK